MDKVCVVLMDGVKYKVRVTSNVEENDPLIDHYLLDKRVFGDIFKAVDQIRKEEKEKGLNELWVDETRDEATDEVTDVYLDFYDGSMSSFTTNRSYHFHVIRVE